MTTWTRIELDKIATANELEITPFGRDGALGKPVIIWVVRVADDLYVRSAYGRSAAWFRRTQTHHRARVRADGVEKDVAVLDADPRFNDQIDAAYRAKYHRHGATYVNMMISSEARSTTIKLARRSG
ncbi:MAG: DUF2255 family protein [Deltaproteobacteria bacterium]|nr:DUF2255 family protein [Deltaproteobacteria bacterium]